MSCFPKIDLIQIEEVLDTKTLRFSKTKDFFEAHSKQFLKMSEFFFFGVSSIEVHMNKQTAEYEHQSSPSMWNCWPSDVALKPIIPCFELQKTPVLSLKD